MKRFNAVKFIGQVKLRPAIWDITSKEYSNGESQRKCWGQLIDLFIGKKITTEKEKLEFGIFLQRQWNILQVCYAKEKHRDPESRKTQCGKSARRSYIYYEKMSFLGNTVKCKDNVNTKMAVPHLNQKPPSKPKEPISNANICKGSDLATDRRSLVKLLNENIQQTLERKELDESEDRMFLLSLEESLKEVPKHLNVPARLELLQVIHKYISFGLSENSNEDPLTNTIPWTNCRLCFESNATTSIFNVSDSLLTLLRTCCNLEVEENDGFSDKICASCESQLKLLSKFKAKCRQSNMIYRTNVVPNFAIKKEKIDADDTEERQNVFNVNVKCGSFIKAFNEKCKNTEDDNHDSNFMNMDFDRYCKICDTIVSAAVSKNHAEAHSVNSAYICDYCGGGFENNFEIASHLIKHTSSSGLDCM